MTGPITPISPGSASYGLSWKSVSVLSVDGRIAIVRDQLSQTFKMDRTMMRAKGTPPAVGETWIVDRSYGNDWTFAMIVNANITPPPPPPVPPPKVISVVNAAERDALINKYVNMTVFRLDDAVTEAWNGTGWQLMEPFLTICRVTLGGNVALIVGDTLAQAGWNVTTNHGFTINTTVGAAYIQVPSSGRYEIDYYLNFDPIASTVHACKVMKNGTDLTVNSITSDTQNSIASGEGTWLHANSKSLLVAGDKLYWQVFTSNAATMNASKLNIASRLTVHRIGPN